MSSARIASWLVSNYPNATMSAVQLITVLRTRGLMAAVREVIKAHPVLILLLTNSATSTAVLYYFARREGGLKRFLFRLVLATAKAMPGTSSVMDSKQQEIVDGLKEEFIGHMFDDEKVNNYLPDRGTPVEGVVETLTRFRAKEAPKYETGRVSGGIYHGGDELTALITKAYGMFCLANPLHPDLFPAVRKMEAEVIQMMVNLFNGGDEGCGVMTSGGTESILMSCKAARDYMRHKKGIVEPEMVVTTTIHAAFDKAGKYFGIKVIRVPVDPVTFKADPRAMEKAITSNTVLIGASTPCFSQGVFDPIEQIGAIADKRDIPFHVDCCLGSLLVPLLNEAGYPTPPLDFRVRGVTQISADTHKFGFTPKGSSVIMYRNKELRSHQYFVASSWMGGIYASPSAAGSRPGALVAGTWAAMIHMGRDGYIDSVKTIMEAAKKIQAGIPNIRGLKLQGTPDASVVCFESVDDNVDIYNVAECMSKRHWNLNQLQLPPGAHICVTYANAPSADAFLADLAASVEEVRTAPKGTFGDGLGSIYGTAAKLPDRSIIDTVAKAFLDVMYMTEM